MKSRLLVGMLVSGLMAVVLAGPAMAGKSTVERFLGPEAVGWCDTLETDSDRAWVGHAKVRYLDGGMVEARLKMRNLASGQLHRVLLHQQGDPFDVGFCNFSDVHYFTTNSKGRITITFAEPAIPGSAGLFVTVYAADAATDMEAFSTYPIYGTEAVYAP